MKTKEFKIPDIERYQENQLYLLKNGTYVMITDVDPPTPISHDNTSRRCTIRTGKTKKKGDEFKLDSPLVIEDISSNISIIFDMSSSRIVTIDELKSKEAYYIGTLSNKKNEEKAKLLHDVCSRLERW